MDDDGVFTAEHEYGYDYRTQRVRRSENGVVTNVVFSEGTSVREVGADGTTVEYVRGSDWGGGVGGVLYTARSNAGGAVLRFDHFNGRGDVVTQTDGAGAEAWKAAYEVFGKRVRELGVTQDRQKAN